MEIIFAPIFFILIVSIVIKVLNGFADSTSDFIYYSTHKYNKEEEEKKYIIK